MTVGDRVILNVGPDESEGLDTLGYRPLIGTVLAQDAGPTVATIQWDNGKQGAVDIPVGALLEVVSPPNQESLLTAKYLQLAGVLFESGSGLELSTGLSPAASGICIEAFRISAFEDSGNPTASLATIAVQDGESFMRVLFVADPTALSDPATIAELEALGVISVRDGRRSVASS